MFGLKKPFCKKYISPGGQYYKLFADMASQTHLLIAGASGSGKSVVINGIIYTQLLHCPDRSAFILLDPKRVELVQYRNCPHVLIYASEPQDMINALEQTISIIERRYRQMQQEGIRKYNGSDVYVIIDELADLMTTDRRHVLPLLQRICQIGRAAKVHLIAATQCPLAKVIPTEIKVNFDSCVGLHTRSAQDSRNILGSAGCEQLPRYGQAYYMTPEGIDLWNIPMYTDEQISALVSYWTSSRCYAA